MKLLHTSDWHLGQNFMFRQRATEHEHFLSWLTQTINDQAIDLLIVAGDIFDTATPPNYALKLYYQFLAGLQQTKCQTVIIISGNHDSAAVLNAPRHILKALNVHVVTSAGIDDEIIWTKDSNGAFSSVVCAVPFLREQDLRSSVPGESWEDKNKALLNGLKTHYQTIAHRAQAAMRQKKAQDLPLIATGHLFATGGIIGEDDHIRQIHLGSLGRFNAGQLPDCFDYVALGHLHRSQTISGNDHIRYSGSPIPLSFGEAAYSKYVLTVDLGKTEPVIEKIKVPSFQTMIRIKGHIQDIVQQIEEYDGDKSSDEIWTEITIQGKWNPIKEEQIKKAAEQTRLKIFAMKRDHAGQKESSKKNRPIKTLNQFTCDAVFEHRLALEPDLTAERKKELIHAFHEIEALARQGEE